MAVFKTKIKDKIANILQKQLFKDSFWMTSFNLISTSLGIAYFIILARYLGAEYYGTFVGIKAIWAIVFPFIGFGMGDILVQEISRDSSKFSKLWGDALITVLGSTSIALITIFPIVALFFSEIPPLFILLIFLGDFLGFSLCLLSKSAFIAHNRIKLASQVYIVYRISKLVATLSLVLFPPASRLIAWGFLYCLGSIIPAIILMFAVSHTFSSPIIQPRRFRISQLKQGFFFSLSASAVTINSEVDRSMLVALSSPLAAGLYSAGYRFIDLGFLPIMSVLGASYARFFKHGEQGIRGTLKFAKKLLPAAIIYGIIFAVFLWIISPLVPNILGEDYAEASTVLVWLSPIHLIAGIQFLAADSLTGAGYQRPRSLVQVAAAIVNISLNLILIPIYSWKGAIAATLCSELFKLVALWLVVLLIYAKTSKSEPQSQIE